MGQVKSKKSKPILTLPCGARLKSRLIPIPPPLRGGENPRELKQGGAGQAEWGKIVIPMGRKHLDPTMYFPFSLLNQTHSKKIFLLICTPKSVGVTLIKPFFFFFFHVKDILCLCTHPHRVHPRCTISPARTMDGVIAILNPYGSAHEANLMSYNSQYLRACKLSIQQVINPDNF